MRVLGLCSLTNAFGEHVEHEEVVRVSNETAIAVGRLLVDLFPRIVRGDLTMTNDVRDMSLAAQRPRADRVGGRPRCRCSR